MLHSKIGRLARTGLLSSAVIVASGAAAFAQIQAGDTIGTSVSDIARSLETNGYDIREIEVKNNRIDADVTLNGIKLEIKVDSTSGEVIKVEND
ncbi:PepSY domain-containing protein [Roseibium sp. MMSF_3544]|uniref:PepSY domain-containing protein n=1 Tax=unclassified Roseibium TaxID=2629323 RepID=UPI00273E2D89|nr:PepSY domain-containing protein [Roseibium sp. MMSF_3544]